MTPPGVPRRKRGRDRVFWTHVGALVLSEQSTIDTEVLPAAYSRALQQPPALPDVPYSSSFTGEQLTERQARHIYTHAWKAIRGLGFSRSARVFPWPGVPLLLLARRSGLGVIAQSFGERVPLRERSLALAGKNAALFERSGIRLLVVAARIPDQVRPILERGRVAFCTPDRAADAVDWLSG
jgi:hypothetical protein